LRGPGYFILPARLPQKRSTQIRSLERRFEIVNKLPWRINYSHKNEADDKSAASTVQSKESRDDATINRQTNVDKTQHQLLHEYQVYLTRKTLQSTVTYSKQAGRELIVKLSKFPSIRTRSVLPVVHSTATIKSNSNQNVKPPTTNQQLIAMNN
jgi:hypothetical protein